MWQRQARLPRRIIDVKPTPTTDLPANPARTQGAISREMLFSPAPPVALTPWPVYLFFPVVRRPSSAAIAALPVGFLDTVIMNGAVTLANELLGHGLGYTRRLSAPSSRPVNSDPCFLESDDYNLEYRDAGGFK